MNSLQSRTVLVALLLAGLATPTAAQQRRAVPRTAAPRAEAPARSEPPRRQDGSAQRSRGTDDQGRVRAPRSNEGREEARAPRVPPTTSTRPESRVESAPPNTATANAESSSDGEQRRAVPRGSRPRGDNPAVGRAVPRDGGVHRGDSGRRGGDSRVFSSRGRYSGRYYPRYGNTYYNYYYPRRWYPYGYGTFGLGYFYYDPYRWHSYDPYLSQPYYYGSYYGGGGYSSDGYYSGELRLQVAPRHAEVYVDGYFAGNVDDFDGTFQGLRLEEGPYKIEIVAPGYETLEFEVRIQPGRKITYRGELRPLRP